MRQECRFCIWWIALRGTEPLDGFALRPKSTDMKKALIIGASGGIGAAVAEVLRGRGVEVTGLSRSVGGLDVTDEACVAAHLGALSGPFDLIFVAVGILAPQGQGPEKALGAIDPVHMAQVLAVNAIGPAMVLKHVGPLLAKNAPGKVVVLSARVGSIGDNQIGGWHSYRASKAALNQIIKGAAIELRRSHKQVVCAALHPGTVATPFTAEYAKRHSTVPPSEAAQNLLSVIDGLSLDDTGGFFDWSGAVVPW